MKRLIETLVLTALLVGFARLLYVSKSINFIREYYATIFAVTFIYVPVMVMWFKHQPIDFVDSSLRMFFRSLRVFIGTALVIFPVYILCAHFWMIHVFGRTTLLVAPYPNLLKTILFQTLLIALPEEFFFRGYMQATLDKSFIKRWNIFGTRLGWAWIITALVFAASHSFVRFQWWHFSIFFPALVFGWLRERTNSITAPVLFHAASNIIADWVAKSYF